MNSEISFPTNLSASLENPLLQQREPVQITTDLGNLERSCGETIDNKGSVATTTKELSHYVAEEVKVTTTESTEEEPITLYDRELADAERNIPQNKIEELEVFYLLKELHFNGRNREEARRLLQQLERFPDLKVLNLAGCSDITDEEVRCIERISTLKELNLTNCTHISTECIINVLNANSGIQRLLLGGNKNLNAQELKKIFEGDRNFKYLDFRNCTQFEKLDLYYIYHEASKFRNEKQWSINIIFPSGKKVSFFSERRIKKKANKIVKEFIADKGIKEDIRKTIEMILRNKPQKTMELFDGNKFENSGIQALAEALKYNATIHSLSFFYLEFSINDIQALNKMVKANQVDSLTFSNNQLDNAKLWKLMKVLKGSRCIQHLCIWSNQVDDAGAQAIATLLKSNQTLERLELCHNQIGDAGMAALAKALKNNQKLKTLFLEDNQIGNSGAKALAATLKHNCKLEHLDFEKNQIGLAGLQAFGMILKVNQTLSELRFGNNQIDDTGTQALAMGLKDNRGLKILSLGRNQIGDIGIQALMAAIKNHPSIESLFLAGNPIGDVGARAIANVLKVNQKIWELDIKAARISVTGARALAEALKENKKLWKLYFDGYKIEREDQTVVNQIEQYLTRNRYPPKTS